MKRFFIAALMLAMAFGVVRAATTAPASDFKLAAPDANPEVATIYRGTLGDAVVQMMLSHDAEDSEHLIGEYFIFGGGNTVLLAGEITGDNFYMEESEDGSAISGYWEGKLVIEGNRGFIIGTWMNNEESLKKPFKLERVMRSRSLLKRVS
jgi:hypothetical protein